MRTMDEQKIIPDDKKIPPETNPALQKTGTGHFLWEIAKFAVLSLVIVAPIRLFIASPFIVSGASMDPTFDTGHYLIIDQITYRLENPVRGDVVVFRYPNDPSKFFIKRIIGLPGDTVNIANGSVSIKNNEFPGGIVLDEPYIAHPKYDTLSTTLKENEYFVMGDNRANSSDSRVWGTLPREYITGRALVRLFPVTEISLFPGMSRY